MLGGGWRSFRALDRSEYEPLLNTRVLGCLMQVPVISTQPMFRNQHPDSFLPPSSWKRWAIPALLRLLTRTLGYSQLINT